MSSDSEMKKAIEEAQRPGYLVPQWIDRATEIDDPSKPEIAIPLKLDGDKAYVYFGNAHKGEFEGSVEKVSLYRLKNLDNIVYPGALNQLATQDHVNELAAGIAESLSALNADNLANGDEPHDHYDVDIFEKDELGRPNVTFQQLEFMRGWMYYEGLGDRGPGPITNKALGLSKEVDLTLAYRDLESNLDEAIQKSDLSANAKSELMQRINTPIEGTVYDRDVGLTRI